MAENLQITALHYGRLERGERRASLEQVEKIAAVLHVSPYELIDGSFRAEKPSTFGEEHVQEIAQKLAGLLQGCSADERELCYDLCERVVRGKRTGR